MLSKQFEEAFLLDGVEYIKNEYTKEISFITKTELESSINKKLKSFKNCKIKVLHIFG